MTDSTKTSTSNNSSTKVIKATNREPYQQAYYPPAPTGFTRYMRQSILWQLVRLFFINIKMLKLMAKSHH